MKKYTKYCVVLSLMSFMLLAPMSLLAQQWSPEQQDVWKNVEAYWALDAAGDLEGFMTYFHPDYLGWSTTDAMPGSKETARKWIAEDYKAEKTLVYTINPLGIKIYSNVAFVHYYWTRRVKDAEGKVKNESGRWTDILMKQGNKWVLIGDHGGITPQH